MYGDDVGEGDEGDEGFRGGEWGSDFMLLVVGRVGRSRKCRFSVLGFLLS